VEYYLVLNHGRRTAAINVEIVNNKVKNATLFVALHKQPVFSCSCPI
jgi:hypothetical protein